MATLDCPHELGPGASTVALDADSEANFLVQDHSPLKIDRRPGFVAGERDEPTPALTPPGAVWSERFELDSEIQKMMNTTPLMRMHQGKIKLDMDSAESLCISSPATKLMSRFRAGLRQMDVDECREIESRAANWVSDAHGVGSRESASSAKRKSAAEKAPVAASRLEEIVQSFRVVAKKQRLHDADTALSVADPPGQNVEIMCVPIGASSLDRITSFDKNNKRLTREYIEVPRNAYEGMPMKHAMPPLGHKLLLVDGSGFKTGGPTTLQHAVRLAVHRKSCTDCWCRVLGCGNDPAYKLFSDVDERLCRDYERHRRASCKHALRAHGHSLRMRAEAQ